MAGFFDAKRVVRLFSALRADAVVLWHALLHPGAPRWLKGAVVALVLYAVSPIDFIPDGIPMLGWLDDIFLLTFAMRWIVDKLPPEVRDHARQRAQGRGAPSRRGTVVEVVD